MSKDGFMKVSMWVEDGKTVELFYNPKEKDPLKAYRKEVVK